MLESIETLQLFDKHYQKPEGTNQDAAPQDLTVKEPEVKEGKRDDWLDDIDDALDEEPVVQEPVKKPNQKWVPKKKVEAKADLENPMKMLATVYKLGSSNIQFMIQLRAGADQSKLTLPLTQDEFFVLQMFYNFTFSTVPAAVQLGANNNLDSNVQHIATNVKKLVEGSTEQLPFNGLYTYATLKNLYQKVIDDSSFMQDPLWVQPSVGGAPMMQMPQMPMAPMFPPTVPQQMQ